VGGFNIRVEDDLVVFEDEMKGIAGNIVSGKGAEAKHGQRRRRTNQATHLQNQMILWLMSNT
jgi:hypothetical protein